MFGCRTFILEFFNVGQGIVYVGLGGLHVVRVLSTFGLVAVHSARVLFFFGYGFVYVWPGWLSSC